MKGNKMIIDTAQENALISVISEIEGFEIIQNGQVKEIKKDDSPFQKICDNVKNLFSSSRLEPAFGVSLHDETLNEMKSGEFLKIKFVKQLIVNDLPFENLLIKLEKDAYGINLIRENNSNYFGRCFYLFLNTQQNLKSLINLD